MTKIIVFSVTSRFHLRAGFSPKCQSFGSLPVSFLNQPWFTWWTIFLINLFAAWRSSGCLLASNLDKSLIKTVMLVDWFSKHSSTKKATNKSILKGKWIILPKRIISPIVWQNVSFVLFFVEFFFPFFYLTYRYKPANSHKIPLISQIQHSTK